MAAIVTIGDPVLRQPAEPAVAGAATNQLIEELYATMKSAEGLGLSAPQIGISKRVVIIEIDGHRLNLVNPVIIAKTGEQTANEGCLSIPSLELPITTAKRVVVRDDFKEFACADLMARAVQHEIDHLDGILITDRYKEQMEKRVSELQAQIVDSLKV